MQLIRAGCAPGRSGEVGYGVEQRAVEVYHHGSDAARQRHGKAKEALIRFLTQLELPLTWGNYKGPGGKGRVPPLP